MQSKERVPDFFTQFGFSPQTPSIAPNPFPSFSQTEIKAPFILPPESLPNTHPHFAPSPPQKLTLPEMPDVATGSRPKHTYPLEPGHPISHRFILPGSENTRGQIGWINGICNTLEESTNSGLYIQKLAGGHTISGIYNHTHTPIVDLAESCFLNHYGYSPITAELLQAEWKLFHEKNADSPNLKLLQICHSQGAIHVKNALQGSPQEIRDRIIVAAVAPAAVVPKHLCFQSYNWASERDIVYKFEPPPPREIESLTLDDVLIPRFKDPLPHQAELVILPAHPEATGIDHGIQSPTFREDLQDILDEYRQHQGEYLPSEKGKKK